MTCTHLRACLGVVAGCGATLTQPVFAASTERVSVSSAEAEAFNNSSSPAISADGRFVAFVSRASNLVPNDTNQAEDVFVRDRLLGTTERVSVTSSGDQANGLANCSEVAISADGRFVAFATYADNLVAGDTNFVCDVFVRDRQLGTTERVSVATGGEQATGGDSSSPSISATGRFVAFQSLAFNLVTGDTNSFSDVFVRDRLMGTTQRVSVSGSEVQADRSSYSPSISANGRLVAFESDADNLVVPNETLGLVDTFVRNRQDGTTQKISVSSSGGEASGQSFSASISADGRFVAFASTATDILTEDGNGQNDIFLRDLQTNTTELISVGFGDDTQGHSSIPSVSSDGRFVAFESGGFAIVPGDTNNAQDIFVRDRQTATTGRVSVTSAGGQAHGNSYAPSISSDGRFVVMQSDAADMVPDDSSAIMDIFVRDRGDLSESRNELLADLGNKGLWQRSPAGRWRKIDPDSPIDIAAGDLDRSFIEEVIASFPGRGLEARFNGSGAWQSLHATAPDRVVSGDFDGNGVADIAGDFSGDLLVRNNNGAWIRRAAASEGLAVGDLDGNGEDELIADRGASGLWARYNNANPWVQLHTLSPVHIAVGDVDDDGLDDLIADLGAGQGIFVRTDNADPWRRVNASTSQGLTTGDLDDDGRDDIIADFPNGLRVRYNNVNPWFTLDTRSPSSVISLDLDRNGEDDVVAGFTDAGISARLNGAGFWRILRPVLDQGFAEGSFN